MNTEEVASLKQLVTVLENYPITLLTHSDLDVSIYLESFGSKAVKIETFPKHFFLSTESYNRLLLSKEFYNRFKKSEYILIYQLDAWVFHNVLKSWCERGYDYVGAPWFDGWGKADNKNLIGVGNGGFSLRKVKTARRILKRVSLLQFLHKHRSKPILKSNRVFNQLLRSLNFYLMLRSVDHIHTVMNGLQMNEDVFWSLVSNQSFTDYKLAPIDVAIEFSFEVNPSYLYQLNNKRLPFGCHAWEKYEPVFWQQFIEVEKIA